MVSSSDGSGSGGIGALLAMQAANPIAGLPVAGKDSSIGDPYDYGMFQEFTPEIRAEGENPSAMGLRPEMFEYRSPRGRIVTPSGGGGGGTTGGGSTTLGGDTGAQIQQLRDQLAQVMSVPSGGGGGSPVIDTWTNRS